MADPVIRDPWHSLKTLTAARIALGRAGGSLPTRELLQFQMDHASARDAVHLPFDMQAVRTGIEALGVGTIKLESAVHDRLDYLKHPEFGRRLSEASRDQLKAAVSASGVDLVIVVSNGLSSLAVHRQATGVLSAWLPLIRNEGWKLAPVVLVNNGRVAVEDEIGAILDARLAVFLIGERPGLGSPDSLGAYLVYRPRVGLSDADRNCVSNIRPEGLPPALAAETIHYLALQSLRRKLSGVMLKDERGLSAIAGSTARVRDSQHRDSRTSR